MSVKELESELTKLSPVDRRTLAEWLQEFVEEEWDRQFEADVAAGRLDKMAKKAREDFNAGLCTPL